MWKEIKIVGPYFAIQMGNFNVVSNMENSHHILLTNELVKMLGVILGLLWKYTLSKFAN